MDHESYCAERVGMVVRKDSLADERWRDRDEKALGETNQCFTSVIAHCTVSCENDRSLCSLQDFRGSRYLSRRRRGITHYIDLERVMTWEHGHFFDIFWQCKIDSAGALGLRKLERLPNHLWHSFRSRDHFSPLCDRLEHAD